jgi:hypothetical protein
MVYRFPGGIRDAAGRRAYLEISPGEVVAIDLSNGTMVWRRARIGQPVAATPTRLLTLDPNGKSFVLRLLDAATGADTGRIENFGMPDWAVQAGTAADAVQVDTEETPTGIRLTWRLRRPYRGGAPPPASIAAKHSEESVGAVVVDPESGRFVPVTDFAPPRPRTAPTAAELGPHAKPAPNIVAFERVGDRLFTLKAETMPGKRTVTLEARDASNGSMLWEAPLTEDSASHPMPQRQ